MIFRQAELDAAETTYAKAKADADEDPANKRLEYLAEKAKADVDASKEELASAKAKAAADCEAKYPPENLTQADGRWVQVAKPLEELEESEEEDE